MKNKLFLILVLWAALTFCECVVAYQEQSEPPQLCTKKALKDLRKEEFKIKIEKDMGGLKSLSKDEKKEWKEYWKDRRNGLKSLKKNSKNSYWEERKARRRNNLVKAPAFEGKKEKSPHGLWKKESKPVRRKFEDYGPDERKAAHRRMKQSKKEWVSVHRQGLLETQSVGYASASEDPNHIEPTDPNYVEPTDPNYVEPTDPNYIEPIDPNYIEPGEIIEVYDDITENQRWTRNNLYWVHNSIDISAWLYIEPGTFVYYGYGAGLHPTEGGLLTSAGIPEMPI